jgi:hypothetical protein
LRQFQNFIRRNILFLAILLIGLFHGVIYIYIVPPWGHYDEPNHFEYSWMIANFPSFPKAGDYDIVLRRQILESMVRNKFYEIRGWTIDLSTLKDPVYIGINQLGDPPIYIYWHQFHFAG